MFSRKLYGAVLVVCILALSACGPMLYASNSRMLYEDSPVVTEQAGAQDSVQEFYDWQLAHTGYDTEADIFRNPLVDGTWVEAPHMSDAYVTQMKETLASGGLHASPVFCAQDVPQRVMAGEPEFITDTEAIVPVKTSFAGHTFTAEVNLIHGEWQIVRIDCGSGPQSRMPDDATPLDITVAFYAQYIGYAGYDPATETIRNPLVDGIYRQTSLLTNDFIARLDAMVESGLPADPILCAQDVPEGFSAEEPVFNETGDEARVRVDTSFEGHHFDVLLKLVEGQWLIDSVQCAVQQHPDLTRNKQWG
jgi:hypothetical protein